MNQEELVTEIIHILSSEDVNIHNSQSEKKIIELINELSIISIRELILKATTVKQLGFLLSAITQNVSSTSIESCQFVVVKAIVEVLCSVDYNATNNEVSELVQSVCIEVDDLTTNEIAHVLNVFMKSFDFEGLKTEGRLEKQMGIVLDILPKLLSMCSSTTVIDSDIEGGDVPMTDFRNHIIQQIIDREWNINYICIIISSLRECHMNDDLIIGVVNKVSGLLSKINDATISSIIYQILLLTNANVSRVVLVSILLNIRRKCHSDLFPSIINHFSFALRNNAMLCKMFFELMKSSILPYTSISLSIVLSLSDTERYRQQVYVMLLTDLRQEYERKAFSWKYSIVANLPSDPKSKELSGLLRSVVDIVESGYSEGIDLLLHFYDYLLHWNGKCEASEKEWLNAFARVSIMDLFSRVPNARLPAMQLIVNEMNRREVNEEFFVLFNALCSSYPAFILSNITSIKTLVSRIPIMSSEVVPSLIQSIHTIIPSRPDLFDILIIILKKCCYQSDENIRMSGVSGLIELLCKGTTQTSLTDSYSHSSISLTQVGTSSIQVIPYQIPQTTVEDALNLIHRYNNTIHSTHSNYYMRFYSLLLKLYRDSPVARSGVLQLLIEKLRGFTDLSRSSQASQLPTILNLDNNCLNGSIQQPIHELIAVTALILHPLHPIPMISTDEQRFQELSSLFDQFIEQLIHTEVEEFHLDKGTNFNPQEAEGKTNLCKRQILTVLYLTVIYVRTVGISCIDGTGTSENAIRTLMIGQISMMLNNMIKINKYVGEKVKDPFYDRIFESVIARPSLLQLLQLLVTMKQTEKNSEVMKAVDSILDDSSVVLLLTNSISHTIQGFSSSVLRKRENSEFCEYLHSISKHCYELHLHYYLEEHSNYSQFCLSLLNLVPESLTVILSSYLLSFYPMELEENPTISQQKEYLCKDFLLTNNNLTITELTALIQSLMSSKQYKIAMIFIQFIRLLIDHLSVTSTELTLIKEWLEKYINSIELPSGYVSTMIGCYCQLASRLNQPIRLLTPLSNCIHNLLTSEPSTGDFKSLDADNSSSVICTLVSSLQTFSKPLSFIHQQCKYYQVKNEIEQDRITHLLPAFFANWKKRTILLCDELYFISQVLIPLLQCDLKVGSGEAILSYLKVFYNHIDQCVKQAAMPGSVCPIQSLDKLVQVISEKLTPLIYNLIHVIQKPGDRDSHIKKQAKLIPEVIFAIEQYEATLVQVNKKTKGNVNLTMYVRRSTARDFRIDMEKLNRKMERKDETEVEPKKKRKLSSQN